ncbi:2,3-dihydro-2,3-dihydroxybenzoate dehydrogenase [Actinophytocola sp.]|uniref:2,3-dihydro-2,3-dihydroxybenzoate dehydrogenase n=1 Tax=Actinophytocola sp. TaxID=1872138 RepID=UPI00389A9DB0
MTYPELADRTALVTGAAGGMGSVIAAQLGACGARVALVDSNAERLRLAAKNLTNDNVIAAAFPTDIRSSAEVNTTVAQAESQLGPIDYLVNAAGILRVAEGRRLSDEDWTQTLAVNTTGTFYVTRAVADRMAERGRGAVVTVASNAADNPRTGMAAYAASKAATTTFTKVMALELAQHGIRCNVVAPGSTDTEMLSSLWTGGDWRRPSIEGVPEQFRLGIPLGKVAQPEDIADAVLFLLSDRAGHITMHTMTVDGGATLGH